jgi:hypothetical protein
MRELVIIRVVPYVLTLTGVGMLAGSGFLYKITSSFLAEAIKAPGTIVALVASKSSDGTTTYRPIVQFKRPNGQTVSFESSTGSNPARYSQGQRVEVFYRPTAPQDAEINDFFSLWGAPAICGALGAAFFAFGGGFILSRRLRERKNAYLLENGRRIETDFQSVELNTSFQVNDRHPFRIVTQWQNPTTAELHIFRSDDIWFDPTAYIKAKTIAVFIDENNLKRYFVDLSVLPKLAP